MSVPDLNEQEAERLALTLQGLASPVRLRILHRLRVSPAFVGEIASDLDLSQTSVSNHLRLLRQLDLVRFDRDGRSVKYELFDDHIATLLDQALIHLGHV